MPLQAIAINDFNTSLMRETTKADELKIRLQDLYDNDQRLHEFVSGEQAVATFGKRFAQNWLLYVGMFNDKPICAVGCHVDRDNSLYRLSQLAMHQQNLNRGIEEQFIKLIVQDSASQAWQWVSDNAKINDIIKQF